MAFKMNGWSAFTKVTDDSHLLPEVTVTPQMEIEREEQKIEDLRGKKKGTYTSTGDFHTIYGGGKASETCPECKASEIETDLYSKYPEAIGGDKNIEFRIERGKKSKKIKTKKEKFFGKIKDLFTKKKK